jgi:flagellar biosynthesis protein FlhF
MRLRTFVDESLPKALLKAKKELGDDIVLLESSEVEDKNNWPGRKIVKITVSTESDTPGKKVKTWKPPSVSAKKKMEKNGEQKKFDEVISNILAKKPREISKEKKILNELAALREEISRLSENTNGMETASFPKNFEDILKRLEQKGVAPDIAKSFIRHSYQLFDHPNKASKFNILKNIKTEMTQKLKRFSFSKNNVSQEVILMLGSSGVGKTASAMKLIAHPQMYANKDAGIISTDPYGQSEALNSFSKISNVSVVEARGSDDLAKQLKRWKNKELIIVDVPGRSPFEANHLSILEEYKKIVKPNYIFLTLAMNTDLEDLFLSNAMFMFLKPNGIILTKFDETGKPGKIFSILKEINLPLVSFSEGKRVFIDVMPAAADYVFKKIFDMERA